MSCQDTLTLTFSLNPVKLSRIMSNLCGSNSIGSLKTILFGVWRLGENRKSFHPFLIQNHILLSEIFPPNFVKISRKLTEYILHKVKKKDGKLIFGNSFRLHVDLIPIYYNIYVYNNIIIC